MKFKITDRVFLQNRHIKGIVIDVFYHRIMVRLDKRCGIWMIKKMDAEKI